ncbi:MAG: hypothetical protein EBY16_09210 [Gammaproteobacteria bacterium]|nr:hypothetical protein [Gammaproteobacteria bacterium]
MFDENTKRTKKVENWVCVWFPAGEIVVNFVISCLIFVEIVIGIVSQGKNQVEIGDFQGVSWLFLPRFSQGYAKVGIESTNVINF